MTAPAALTPAAALDPSGLPRRRGLVLQALQRAARGCSGDGESAYVCMRRLTHQQVGGNRAGARLHELRTRHGIALDKRTCQCHQCRWSRDRAVERGDAPTYLDCWRLADWQAVRERGGGA